MVIGPTACRSEALLVKSILRYYNTAQGRGGGLHFHIISDADSTAILRTLFTSWSLPNVEVTFYPEEHFHVSRLGTSYIFQKYVFSSANLCSLFILACVRSTYFAPQTHLLKKIFYLLNEHALDSSIGFLSAWFVMITVIINSTRKCTGFWLPKLNTSTDVQLNKLPLGATTH